MKRRILILMGCSMFFLLSAQDKRVPSQQVKMEGYVNERLLSSIQNRILAQDVDRLVAVFKEESRTETRLWQSEFWGKWLTSAILAFKYNPSKELSEKLDYAVSQLIKTQSKDGYIGNYAPQYRLEQWDIWGRKYCMLGLLDYYELKKDEKSLDAAQKLADNLIDDLNKADGIIVTKGNYRGMAASSVLEPVTRLYNYTKKDKYLSFAKKIVQQWSLPEGPQLIEKSKVDVAKRFPKPERWYSWEQGQKAYEMMSCYEGLLELYRVTGEDEYKKAVIDVWENINLTEINIAGSGASTEMWFGGKSLQTHPVHHFQEVCVTVTWIKLCLQLFRLTGEPKYAEAAEFSYFNALLGSLDKSGTQWAKYTPLNGQRLPGSEQCGMGLNCCEASGPRGLFLMPFYAVTSNNSNEIQLNYFVAGEYEANVNGQKVLIEQLTEYPANGKVTIRLKMQSPIAFDLMVRIPTWSKDSKMTLNRITVNEIVESGSYYHLNRTWKNGDVITLDLDMQGRVENLGEETKFIAVLRGPIVLARDAVFDDKMPLGASIQPFLDDKGILELVPVYSDENVWMKFKAKFIPESYTEGSPKPVEITLCDYASAGNIRPFSIFQTWFPQLINKSE